VQVVADPVADSIISSAKRYPVPSVADSVAVSIISSAGRYQVQVVAVPVAGSKKISSVVCI
jgi:hypothetical protein